MVFYESPGGLALQFSCQTDLDAVLRPPDMIRRSAKTAVVQIKAGWCVKLPRGQRVLDGLAGVRVDGRLESSSFRDSEAVSVEMDVSNVALVP